MTMNILAIIGTPTREEGYTTKTVQALEKSICALSDATVDYLYLSDLQLGGCQGHLTCVKQGEQQCPFYSDVKALEQKMLAADAVIFASPVHCFNVSTLMKNMIDLFVYQMHRPAFFGKKAVVVAAAAGAGQNDVLKYLRKTVAIWGFEVVGKLGTHAGLFDEAPYQPKLKVAADKVAGQLIAGLENKKLPQPGAAELINFRVWRSVIKRTEHESPYDYKHWQQAGWFKQNYYYATRINPLANSLASFIEAMINRAIRKVSVKPRT
jgi:multimeric flavodoxin WrbA